MFKALPFLGLAAILACTGCESTRQAKTTPTGLPYGRAEMMKKVWLDPAADFSAWRTVVIETPAVQGEELSEEQKDQMILFQKTFTRELATAMAGRGHFQLVTTNATEVSGQKALRLQTLLVPYTKNSAQMKSGKKRQSYLKMEGKLLADEATQPMLAFETQEKGDWFFSLFYGPRTIKRDSVTLLAQDIARMIEAAARRELVIESTASIP